MKVIYVAGKYRDESESQIFENIMHARKVALQLWKRGWAVICPHANTVFMGFVGDERDGSNIFLLGDLEILKRCDAIYMLNNWRASSGAKGELELAKKLNLEVYYEASEI